MTRSLVLFGVVAVGATMLVACGSRPAEQPGAPGETTPEAGPDASSPETLLDEWRQLADDAAANLGGVRGQEIVAELITRDPDGFMPIFEFLEDPASAPAAKVFAYESLRCVVATEGYRDRIIPRLTALVDATLDPTSRACGLQLLAMTNDGEFAPVYRKYAQDGDSRVRVASLSGLVHLGDAAARAEMATLYRDPATRREERQRIVYDLCLAPLESDAPLLEKVVGDSEVPDDTRRIAMLSLGRIGTLVQVPALERCAVDTDLPEGLRELAKVAAESIEARANASDGTSAIPGQESPAE